MTENIRVIPVLTIIGDKLVKTVKFKKPNYIGDPINAVKIFNDNEVDELLLLDIRATVNNNEPNYSKIEEICSEAFMPFGYGGGITNMDQIKKLFKLGIEKVILNSSLKNSLGLVTEASIIFGSQSIVVSIDVKKSLFGKYQVYVNSGQKRLNVELEDYVKMIMDAGAGELFINSIDRDGTFKDFDLGLISLVSKISNLPVVVCGGANSLLSFKSAVESGASAIAAGSLFVYRGENKGILINYPSQKELKTIFTD
ncbi:AglZ/HisF2 family acetamidino modification protein [Vicingaceae bacterium]|nr:AglZ/HisF2 family acetamidino modification protein [Vicingaceae bacterium]